MQIYIALIATAVRMMLILFPRNASIDQAYALDWAAAATAPTLPMFT
jgi:hypothetical protein